MIDIIIPVYDTPLDDLKRCFESVLNQTFKDYKVYLIDDGSKDETRDFLDDYAKDKGNFFVKHINNSGVSNARNLGIDISKGKYLTFVDADDSVESDFLSQAFEIIEENKLDLVVGGYNEIKNNEIIKTRLCLPGLHIYDESNIDLFFDKLLSSKTAEDNKELGNCPTGRIYTRLFKRESLGKLRFSTDIKMSEDTLFMIDYMYLNPRIGVVDKVWYNYYVNDYSISNGTDKDKLINRINEFILEIEKRYDKEINKRRKKAYEARLEKANRYIDEIKNTDN